LIQLNKKKKINENQYKKKQTDKYIFQTFLNRPLYEADFDGFPLQYVFDKDDESSITIAVNN
jgi:hypothetical protein